MIDHEFGTFLCRGEEAFNDERSNAPAQITISAVMKHDQ